MEAKRRRLNHTSESGTKLQNGSSHTSSIITVEVDTTAPISTIQYLIGQRLHSKELVNHKIFLQDIKLVPALSLYDQGVTVLGKVELSVQVETQGDSGKLTIVEIAKNVTDDEINGMMDKSKDTPPSETGETKSEKERESDAEKVELGIPCDPKLWTPEQVYRWMVWVAREFSLDTSIIEDLGITGKRLSSLTIEEFFIKIPYGNILWSHLSLLKKISSNDPTELTSTEEVPLNLVTNNVQQPKTSYLSTPATTVRHATSKAHRSPKKDCGTSEKTLTGARSGNNGQIQLWQFLLDLLTDANEQHLITWVGHEGEFKLLQPERVAQKWGERKNKPAMNYEKLSRALRYYYDGDMISKVQGKRFVYKFVCNLKELLGYDAGELNQLVTECEKNRRAHTNNEIAILSVRGTGRKTLADEYIVSD